jgi:hypothetical protein
MPRPNRIFDQYCGRGREVKIETVAEETGRCERTVEAWKDEDDGREPKFSDLENLFSANSTLIPTAFKLTLAYQLFKRCPDLRVTPCAETDAADAPPMLLTMDASQCLLQLQRLVYDAQCPRGPGGVNFTAAEADRVASVRAEFDLVVNRLWRAIEKRTLKSQRAG